MIINGGQSITSVLGHPCLPPQRLLILGPRSLQLLPHLLPFPLHHQLLLLQPLHLLLLLVLLLHLIPHVLPLSPQVIDLTDQVLILTHDPLVVSLVELHVSLELLFQGFDSGLQVLSFFDELFLVVHVLHSALVVLVLDVLPVYLQHLHLQLLEILNNRDIT